MGSLYRSEPMVLCQLFIQSESAYDSINLLGEMGITQFKDLNVNRNSFQRKFVNELKRCNEMDRQLKYFEKQMIKEEVPMIDCDTEPSAPTIKELTILEAQLENLEKELLSVSATTAELKKNYHEMTELRYLLKRTQQFFAQESLAGAERDMKRRLSVANVQAAMRRFSVDVRASELSAPKESTETLDLPFDPVTDINFIGGTIINEKMLTFERMLWRISMGNVFIHQVPIDELLEDPITGDLMSKCIFIIVFQGDALKNRVKKICEGFHVTLYPCPESPNERIEMLSGVMSRVEDMEMVIKQTVEHKKRILTAAAKNIRKWRVTVLKMKSIYETMNMLSFDVTTKCMIGECWSPQRELHNVQRALEDGQRISGSAVPSVVSQMHYNEDPPTYFRVNKLTRGFQNIVDAYGVAAYREVNPAPFTIISFPFLYAVMFGDAGHGLIMLLFALWMVIREKQLSAMKSQNEIWLTFFNGRYIILLMSIFSIYVGFIYNDVFSKSVNFFGTGWELNDFCRSNSSILEYEGDCDLDPNATFTKNDPYPLGIDPIWQISKNKILYVNSYKMKLSVILGVIQMFAGVMLSVMNHIHFKNWINIFCEFIPQVIFMMSIFGYMNVMIFWKWIKYPSTDSSCAPSVLITLINMFLFKPLEWTEGCQNKNFLYDQQNTVQMILVFAAVICIPWMLIIKPIYSIRKMKKMKRLEEIKDSNSSSYHKANDFEMKDKDSNSSTIEMPHSSSDEMDSGHGHDSHGTSTMDIFINQAIHTIEYCLGLVSHTASYLRLWALSLAHSQLSEVLWNMVMVQAFSLAGGGSGSDFPVMGVAGGALMYFIFSAWAVLTIGILLLMEGLSAFLHALRLHWVEFQSKFYSGSGYLFEPFSFKNIIDLTDAKSAEESNA